MLEGNRCELCNEVVHGTRARHKQTKYCEDCAKARKKENSLCPWLPEQKRTYMRGYMRTYRKKHPRLSSPYVRKHRKKARVSQSPTYLRSFAWFLPLLYAASLSSETIDFSFDALRTVIAYLELLVVKVASLVIVSVICWRHLVHIWRDKGK